MVDALLKSIFGQFLPPISCHQVPLLLVPPNRHKKGADIGAVFPSLSFVRFRFLSLGNVRW